MDETILTLAELKAYLGIATDDNTQNAKLSSILAALAPWLYSVTGTWFGSLKVEVAEIHDKEPVVFTKHMPVAAIQAIRTGYSADHSSANMVDLSADDYRWNTEGRVVLSMAYPTVDSGRSDYDEVQIDYTHGIVTVPLPVKEAAKIFAAGLYNTNTAGGKEITSEQVGGYKKTYQTSTLQQTLLQPWVIIKL